MKLRLMKCGQTLIGLIGLFEKFQTALIHTAAIFLFYNQHECVRRLLLRPSEFGIKP